VEADADGSDVNAMAAMALSVHLRLCRPEYGWRLWSLSDTIHTHWWGGVGWGGLLSVYAFLLVATV
jgi:hypothetical protein